MNKNTLTFKKASYRIDDNIYVYDINPLTNNIDHMGIMVEVEKLFKKSVYKQLNTDELKQIKEIIDKELENRSK